MNAYRQYGLLTGILIVATVYVVHAGIIGWAMSRFPELQGQIISVIIVGVFLYTYVIDGHRAAKLLSENERTLNAIENGARLIDVSDSDIKETLVSARTLHVAGEQIGQNDFATLYGLLREQFEERMHVYTGKIDTIRVFLFFAGLLFTVIGIVQGFASQQFPTNPEEAKMFSFTIIKALGLAYLPATECLGATLILFILSSVLQSQAAFITARFSAVLYQIAFFGEMIAEVPIQTSITEIGGLVHEQTS